MLRRTTTLIFLGALAFACKKEEPRTDAPAPESSDVGPVEAIDPELAEAMAAASAAPPSAKQEGGPPQHGIFAPGEADKEVKAADAFKVTVGNEGSTPKVRIGPVRPAPGAKAK